MARTINDIITETLEQPITVELNQKYKNNIDLTGFVLRKPKIITSKTSGIKSVSFILYQLHQNAGFTRVTSYSCLSFDNDLIEQFAKLNNVVFLSVLGALRYSKVVKSTYCEAFKVNTSATFDIDLIEQYTKEKDND